MNSNNNYLNERFNHYAGRSCKNSARVHVTIQYIDKAGFFANPGLPTPYKKDGQAVGE